jgi:2-oxoglutarate ferredoxin oxidoreductase subunit beta
MLFGKDRNKGIRLRGLDPEVVEVGKECGLDDVLVHDEKAEEPSLAYLLSRMVYPRFPECVGVFRAVNRPSYEQLLQDQIDAQIKAKGKGDLEKLFRNDDLWVVE